MSVASLSSRLPACERLYLQLHTALSKFESSDSSDSSSSSSAAAADGAASDALEYEIRGQLDELSRLVSECEALVDRESGQRRETWKQRVAIHVEKWRQLQTDFERAIHKKTRNHFRMGQSRQQLLSSFNSSAASTSSSSTNKSAIDSLSREQVSLISSHRIIDENLSMSRGTLSNLSEQGGLLKGVQRKIFDVANVMGMSQSLVKLSERKETINAFITYGCMIFTTILVFVLYYYFRYLPKHSKDTP